jgi:hypothetical protein
MMILIRKARRKNGIMKLVNKERLHIGERNSR